MILICDPGIRGCGCALFSSGEREPGVIASLDTLKRAGYVRNPTARGNDIAACRTMAQAVTKWAGHGITEIVGEWPRVYVVSKQRKGGTWTDPNDLLPLPGVDCALAALFPAATVHTIKPDEWKGQMGKEAMNARVLGRLTPAELAVIEHVGELDHNTYDAIGIGLHHVGRLERKRVIAR